MSDIAPSSFSIPRAALQETRCPTCRAAWCGAAICARCGTDLDPLMRLATKAWQLREQARQALCRGDRTAEALAWAQAACQLQATARGLRLLALALIANGAVAEAVAVIEQMPNDE